MADTYTTSNRLEKMEPGQYLDTWGTRLNAQGGSDLVDASLDGVEGFALSGPLTLTNNNGASDQARKRVLNVTGGTGGTITIPNVAKNYLVRNASSGDVIITTGSGTTATIKTTLVKWVFCDGSNNCYPTSGPDFGAAALTVGNTTINGTAAVSGILSPAVGVQIVGSSLAPSGSGLEARFIASAGLIAAVNRATAAYLNISLQGLTTQIYAAASGSPTSGVKMIEFNGVDILLATHTTTASAANAYIDTGANNALKRSTSSEVYKREIEPVSDEVARKSLSLVPIWYRSNCEGDNQKWSWYGVSAEGVAKVDPRFAQWGYHESDYDTVAEPEPYECEVGTDDAGEPVYETRYQEKTHKELKPGAKLSPVNTQYDRLAVVQVRGLMLELADLRAKIEAMKAA
ncbi:MAG: hypothetical protein JWN69_2525 [Alphaproteobacteria bacterium]|nr:hypothetical protein [Alphaproteobacteria bacterium]